MKARNWTGSVLGQGRRLSVPLPLVSSQTDAGESVAARFLRKASGSFWFLFCVTASSPRARALARTRVHACMHPWLWQACMAPHACMRLPGQAGVVWVGEEGGWVAWQRIYCHDSRLDPSSSTGAEESHLLRGQRWLPSMKRQLPSILSSSRQPSKESRLSRRHTPSPFPSPCGAPARER